MAFRIRSIDYTADHRRIVRDQQVDKAALTIGRSAGAVRVTPVALNDQKRLL